MENSSRLQQNILKEKVVKSVVTLLKELKDFPMPRNSLLRQERYMEKNMITVK